MIRDELMIMKEVYFEKRRVGETEKVRSIEISLEVGVRAVSKEA